MLAGVGRTALGVAAVRAHESGRPDRLFDDPFAASFVAAVPGGIGERLDRTDEQKSVGAAFAAHAVLRTRFYDEYLLAANTRQVVLLAAGLDTRAFRLPWPDRVRVFEVDLPEVLAFKQTVLDARAAAPACVRTTVAADLSSPDWAEHLAAGGFDARRPTAWLIEGVLIYLTHEAAETLLSTVDDLSAPGSRVAFEYTTGATDDLLDQARKTAAMAGYAELWQGGLAVDAADWLRERGWRPTVHALGDLAAGYGRPLRRRAASSLLEAVRDG
ncbi:MAG TPA: SAM-dependent methyltransferase [Pseudonocardiaceae bacterium]